MENYEKQPNDRLGDENRPDREPGDVRSVFLADTFRPISTEFPNSSALLPSCKDFNSELALGTNCREKKQL